LAVLRFWEFTNWTRPLDEFLIIGYIKCINQYAFRKRVVIQNTHTVFRNDRGYSMNKYRIIGKTEMIAAANQGNVINVELNRL